MEYREGARRMPRQRLFPAKASRSLCSVIFESAHKKNAGSVTSAAFRNFLCGCLPERGRALQLFSSSLMFFSTKAAQSSKASLKFHGSLPVSARRSATSPLANGDSHQPRKVSRISS